MRVLEVVALNRSVVVVVFVVVVVAVTLNSPDVVTLYGSIVAFNRLPFF